MDEKRKKKRRRRAQASSPALPASCSAALCASGPSSVVCSSPSSRVSFPVQPADSDANVSAACYTSARSNEKNSFAPRGGSTAPQPDSSPSSPPLGKPRVTSLKKNRPANKSLPHSPLLSPKTSFASSKPLEKRRGKDLPAGIYEDPSVSRFLEARRLPTLCLPAAAASASAGAKASLLRGNTTSPDPRLGEKKPKGEKELTHKKEKLATPLHRSVSVLPAAKKTFGGSLSKAESLHEQAADQRLEAPKKQLSSPLLAGREKRQSTAAEGGENEAEGQPEKKKKKKKKRSDDGFLEEGADPEAVKRKKKSSSDKHGEEGDAPGEGGDNRGSGKGTENAAREKKKKKKKDARVQEEQRPSESEAVKERHREEEMKREGEGNRKEEGIRGKTKITSNHGDKEKRQTTRSEGTEDPEHARGWQVKQREKVQHWNEAERGERRENEVSSCSSDDDEDASDAHTLLHLASWGDETNRERSESQCSSLEETPSLFSQDSGPSRPRRDPGSRYTPPRGAVSGEKQVKLDKSRQKESDIQLGSSQKRGNAAVASSRHERNDEQSHLWGSDTLFGSGEEEEEEEEEEDEEEDEGDADVDEEEEESEEEGEDYEDDDDYEDEASSYESEALSDSESPGASCFAFSEAEEGENEEEREDGDVEEDAEEEAEEAEEEAEESFEDQEASWDEDWQDEEASGIEEAEGLAEEDYGMYEDMGENDNFVSSLSSSGQSSPQLSPRSPSRGPSAVAAPLALSPKLPPSAAPRDMPSASASPSREPPRASPSRSPSPSSPHASRRSLAHCTRRKQENEKGVEREASISLPPRRSSRLAGVLALPLSPSSPCNGGRASLAASASPARGGASRALSLSPQLAAYGAQRGRKGTVSGGKAGDVCEGAGRRKAEGGDETEKRTTPASRSSTSKDDSANQRSGSRLRKRDRDGDSRPEVSHHVLSRSRALAKERDNDMSASTISSRGPNARERRPASIGTRGGSAGGEETAKKSEETGRKRRRVVQDPEESQAQTNVMRRRGADREYDLTSKSADKSGSNTRSKEERGSRLSCRLSSAASPVPEGQETEATKREGVRSRRRTADALEGSHREMTPRSHPSASLPFPSSSSPCSGAPGAASSALISGRDGPEKEAEEQRTAVRRRRLVRLLSPSDSEDDGDRPAPTATESRRDAQNSIHSPTPATPSLFTKPSPSSSSSSSSSCSSSTSSWLFSGRSQEASDDLEGAWRIVASRVDRHLESLRRVAQELEREREAARRTPAAGKKPLADSPRDAAHAVGNKRPSASPMPSVSSAVPRDAAGGCGGRLSLDEQRRGERESERESEEARRRTSASAAKFILGGFRPPKQSARTRTASASGPQETQQESHASRPQSGNARTPAPHAHNAEAQSEAGRRDRQGPGDARGGEAACVEGSGAPAVSSVRGCKVGDNGDTSPDGGRDAEEEDVLPDDVDCNITLEDVGGLTEAIGVLEEAAAGLLNPQLFSSFSNACSPLLRPPRGVLLCGPPGTGKTLLVRAFVGSLRQAGHRVSLFVRRGGELLSKWVGEAEKSLMQLFAAAEKHAPSIIFFDELDGMAPCREKNLFSKAGDGDGASSSGSGVGEQAALVATLLALMDGLKPMQNVLIFGATNCPQLIDSALRRPGRFDRECRFMPFNDVQSCLSILKKFLREQLGVRRPPVAGLGERPRTKREKPAGGRPSRPQREHTGERGERAAATCVEEVDASLECERGSLFGEEASREEELLNIAQEMRGMTGAEIQRVVMEAAMAATRREKPELFDISLLRHAQAKCEDFDCEPFFSLFCQASAPPVGAEESLAALFFPSQLLATLLGTKRPRPVPLVSIDDVEAAVSLVKATTDRGRGAGWTAAARGDTSTSFGATPPEKRHSISHRGGSVTRRVMRLLDNTSEAAHRCRKRQGETPHPHFSSFPSLPPCVTDLGGSLAENSSAEDAGEDVSFSQNSGRRASYPASLFPPSSVSSSSFSSSFPFSFSSGSSSCCCLWAAATEASPFFRRPVASVLHFLFRFHDDLLFEAWQRLMTRDSLLSLAKQTPPPGSWASSSVAPSEAAFASAGRQLELDHGDTGDRQLGREDAITFEDRESDSTMPRGTCLRAGPASLAFPDPGDKRANLEVALAGPAEAEIGATDGGIVSQENGLSVENGALIQSQCSSDRGAPFSRSSVLSSFDAAPVSLGVQRPSVPLLQPALAGAYRRGVGGALGAKWLLLRAGGRSSRAGKPAGRSAGLRPEANLSLNKMANNEGDNADNGLSLSVLRGYLIPALLSALNVGARVELSPATLFVGPQTTGPGGTPIGDILHRVLHVASGQDDGKSGAVILYQISELWACLSSLERLAFLDCLHQSAAGGLRGSSGGRMCFFIVLLEKNEKLPVDLSRFMAVRASASLHSREAFAFEGREDRTRKRRHDDRGLPSRETDKEAPVDNPTVDEGAALLTCQFVEAMEQRIRLWLESRDEEDRRLLRLKARARLCGVADREAASETPSPACQLLSSFARKDRGRKPETEKDATPASLEGARVTANSPFDAQAWLEEDTPAASLSLCLACCVSKGEQLSQEVTKWTDMSKLFLLQQRSVQRRSARFLRQTEGGAGDSSEALERWEEKTTKRKLQATLAAALAQALQTLKLEKEKKERETEEKKKNRGRGDGEDGFEEAEAEAQTQQRETERQKKRANSSGYGEAKLARLERQDADAREAEASMEERGEADRDDEGGSTSTCSGKEQEDDCLRGRQATPEVTHEAPRREDVEAVLFSDSDDGGDNGQETRKDADASRKADKEKPVVEARERRGEEGSASEEEETESSDRSDADASCRTETSDREEKGDGEPDEESETSDSEKHLSSQPLCSSSDTSGSEDSQEADGTGDEDESDSQATNASWGLGQADEERKTEKGQRNAQSRPATVCGDAIGSTHRTSLETKERTEENAITDARQPAIDKPSELDCRSRQSAEDSGVHNGCMPHMQEKLSQDPEGGEPPQRDFHEREEHTHQSAKSDKEVDSHVGDFWVLHGLELLVEELQRRNAAGAYSSLEAFESDLLLLLLVLRRSLPPFLRGFRTFSREGKSNKEREPGCNTACLPLPPRASPEGSSEPKRDPEETGGIGEAFGGGEEESDARRERRVFQGESPRPLETTDTLFESDGDAGDTEAASNWVRLSLCSSACSFVSATPFRDPSEGRRFEETEVEARRAEEEDQRREIESEVLEVYNLLGSDVWRFLTASFGQAWNELERERHLFAFFALRASCREASEAGGDDRSRRRRKRKEEEELPDQDDALPVRGRRLELPLKLLVPCVHAAMVAFVEKRRQARQLETEETPGFAREPTMSPLMPEESSRASDKVRRQSHGGVFSPRSALSLTPSSPHCSSDREQGSSLPASSPRRGSLSSTTREPSTDPACCALSRASPRSSSPPSGAACVPSLSVSLSRPSATLSLPLVEEVMAVQGALLRHLLFSPTLQVFLDVFEVWFQRYASLCSAYQTFFFSVAPNLCPLLEAFLLLSLAARQAVGNALSHVEADDLSPQSDAHLRDAPGSPASTSSPSVSLSKCAHSSSRPESGEASFGDSAVAARFAIAMRSAFSSASLSSFSPCPENQSDEGLFKRQGVPLSFFISAFVASPASLLPLPRAWRELKCAAELFQGSAEIAGLRNGCCGLPRYGSNGRGSWHNAEGHNVGGSREKRQDGALDTLDSGGSKPNGEAEAGSERSENSSSHSGKKSSERGEESLPKIGSDQPRAGEKRPRLASRPTLGFSDAFLSCPCCGDTSNYPLHVAARMSGSKNDAERTRRLLAQARGGNVVDAPLPLSCSSSSASESLEMLARLAALRAQRGEEKRVKGGRLELLSSWLQDDERRLTLARSSAAVENAREGRETANSGRDGDGSDEQASSRVQAGPLHLLLQAVDSMTREMLLA
ncbi:ATPase, AAA family protein [Toxoplasma gondii GAB2-2007-GAL-DOM2]|uniref:ATPase, AAA family protein n=1 Tax=Toxoplasma gondii GAB2-2007-GAL-DOM2 TaxID=1130820 RepID=A0A086KQW1_TOXGO|nr:ATPase, AAA family protein [Toxoplasma gondii GAB2-2007-GAL-DOM2]